MKKLLSVVMMFAALSAFSQGAFTTGEYFKFRIHYGLVNAGYATLEVQDAVRSNKKVHHVVGRGYTTGMTKFFFKVEDNYESYFDKSTGKPYQFVRKINEGGYTKNQEGFFNQSANTVTVKDYKNNSQKTISVTENVQDIVSSF
ncbi:ATP-dependent exonuclease, partial [Nostoc linckia z16]